MSAGNRNGHPNAPTRGRAASPVAPIGALSDDGGFRSLAAEHISRQGALIVAADYPSADQALQLAGALRGLPVWLKVGLELFTAEGPPLLRRLEAMGFALFLDLKFHDIPNTVQGAVRSASALGVRMLTVHTAGGAAMCRAAVAGRAEAAFGSKGGGKDGPLLMGVTVLTSESADPAVMRGRVLERALLARECGLDGVVCSGLEAKAVKDACGPNFLCLCPGIRFAGCRSNDDQARVCTPAQAVLAGANFIVMGRPIIKADDPALAAGLALKEIHSVAGHSI